MGWEQRSHDFSNAQVDAQTAYIESEREVKRLQDENAKLRELVKAAWHCVLVTTDGHEGHWFTGEEIVRCRDCKRFSLDNSDHDYRSGWWCHRWNTDMVKPDGFCAWGKKN